MKWSVYNLKLQFFAKDKSFILHIAVVFAQKLFTQDTVRPSMDRLYFRLGWANNFWVKAYETRTEWSISTPPNIFWSRATGGALLTAYGQNF